MKKLFLFIFTVTSVIAQEPWAHTYKHIYSVNQMRQNKRKDMVQISNHKSLPFTQLVFSWNAYRPQRGTFTFYARVKDKKTQTWDQWHKMVEWGSDIQKSHFSRGKHSVFNYARLEMEKNRKGDAFQVKVMRDGKKASLGHLKGVMVTAADFTRFTIEPYNQRGKNLDSCRVAHVPKKSQIMIDHPRCNALCSPTSVSMVVEAITGKPIEPLSFSSYVYDEGLDVFGNWGFNMAHAFEESRNRALFYTTRLGSFNELHALLKQNIPVAVSVRGAIPGAKKDYNNGHLLVVVGFDAKNKKVLCYDPAFDTHDEVGRKYDLQHFIVAWERSHRLTYKPEVLS
ncbi:MAG: hypothetical protein ACJAZS_000729 [Alteromonas naphthalenivorans]|jgi:hypothetical protein